MVPRRRQALMKLLVFAHTPPPLHGQSQMVATLIEGLRPDREIELFHVNPRLSLNQEDIGRWRPGKLLRLLAACLQALRLRLQHGAMVFYYVPAPGKRSALYRDWLVLLLCRPFFPSLVLHWHAVGLGAWLQTQALAPERWLTHLLLGRADLALILAPELSSDAERLWPRRVAIVPNGLPDPGERPLRTSSHHNSPTRVLFIGLGSRTKGLWDTLDALVLLHAREPGAWALTVAGGFSSREDACEFDRRLAPIRAIVRHVGFADEGLKRSLFTESDVLCFPTTYPHEAQPLVVIEALAYDLPIITTRWRALPGMLPNDHVWFVEPGRPDQIADALCAARETDVPRGTLRRHFLSRFTREHYLTALRAALLSLTRSRSA